MTRDDIIRMAREAGLQPYYDAQEPAIERFFRLAYEAGAAAERERLASAIDHQCRVMKDYFEVKWLRELAAAIRARGNA